MENHQKSWEMIFCSSSSEKNKFHLFIIFACFLTAQKAQKAIEKLNHLYLLNSSLLFDILSITDMLALVLISIKISIEMVKISVSSLHFKF